MSDQLSQGDVDGLLTDIQAGKVAAKDASAPGDRRRIKVYDFKRPDKFSKDQIRTVSIMHETFARLATTTLSAQLRTLAHVHVASVDQLTYEEFIRSIPNPTTLADRRHGSAEGLGGARDRPDGHLRDHRPQLRRPGAGT